MRIHSIKGSPLRQTYSHHAGAGGFTLVEVTTSIFIAGLVFVGILMGYVRSGQRAEWSGLSLAAQAYGIQQIEQARAAAWDLSQVPPTNQIPNLNLIGWTYSTSDKLFRGYTWTNIDIPYAGSNFIRATNFVTINTNVQIVAALTNLVVTSVQVQTVWRYNSKNATNTLVNYYAPDQ
jgi:type II secretory pathway pseudopilin PulG